jgi:hypothetical protein
MTQYGSLREKIAAESAERKARYVQFRETFDRAYNAGLEAGRNAIPHTMVVQDGFTGKTVDVVSEGACGFAWVRIFPATCSFARWLAKNNLARAAYHGGMEIWISDHGQSIERKEAHARAMAEVLTSELGVKAYVGSRLD